MHFLSYWQIPLTDMPWSQATQVKEVSLYRKKNYIPNTVNSLNNGHLVQSLLSVIHFIGEFLLYPYVMLKTGANKFGRVKYWSEQVIWDDMMLV